MLDLKAPRPVADCSLELSAGRGPVEGNTGCRAPEARSSFRPRVSPEDNSHVHLGRLGVGAEFEVHWAKIPQKIDFGGNIKERRGMGRLRLRTHRRYGLLGIRHGFEYLSL